MTLHVVVVIYCVVMKGKIKGHKRVKRCEVCGKEFIPRDGHPSQRTCSVECRSKNLSKARAVKYENLIKVCEVCGAEYTPKISFQRFCSSSCGQKAYLQRKKAKETSGVIEVLVERRSNYVKRGTCEAVEIRDVRKREGLEAYSPGRVECRYCGRNFWSWDKKRNKVCKQCKESVEYQELL